MFGEIAQSVHSHLSDLPWSDWLARRRWYVRRSDATAPHLRDVVLLGPCAACFVAAGPDEYFVPLVAAMDGAADAMVDQDGVRWIDGLEDPVGIREILAACLGAPVGPRHRRISGRLLERDGLEASLRGEVRTGTADQTNSWALVGDTFVKVFRRLEPGGNLDVEVLEALAARQYLSVPHLRGVLVAAGTGEEKVLAAFQKAVPHECNAWDKACAEVGVVACGGTVSSAPWRDLGDRTARLHAGLAAVFGVATVPTEARADFGLAAAGLARDVLRELETAPRETWSDEVLCDVTQVGLEAGRIAAIFAHPAPADLPLQRVHGDYHLGQVLSSPEGWTILDFEGEPARTPQERRAPAPAAKDVAGMLRSFDYASRAGLPAGSDALARTRALHWRDAARTAFLEGYFSVAEVQALWPAAPSDRELMLAHHEAEKAFYELRYELRHRPDWMPIPLGGLLALATGAP